MPELQYLHTFGFYTVQSVKKRTCQISVVIKRQCLFWIRDLNYDRNYHTPVPPCSKVNHAMWTSDMNLEPISPCCFEWSSSYFTTRRATITEAKDFKICFDMCKGYTLLNTYSIHFNILCTFLWAWYLCMHRTFHVPSQSVHDCDYTAGLVFDYSMTESPYARM